MFKPKFVGLLSCSGEEYPCGTISRLATRKVLDEYLKGMTTTVCVPLFLAGDEQEQNFVKKFPCITIDGCDKACAKKGVESIGVKPVESIFLNEFFNPQEYEEIEKGPLNDFKWKNHEYCTKLAEHIANLTVKYLDP
ncbi:MAG: hypothetical protein DRO88_01280 [Promethearchaeia archaeon]|nr:MAG: hypothetical protein DRO88_01280 [Candidatus Lokiarchaeia archaeon]